MKTAKLKKKKSPGVINFLCYDTINFNIIICIIHANQIKHQVR